MYFKIYMVEEIMYCVYCVNPVVSNKIALRYYEF